MALQKTVTEKHGFTASNAYHRAEHIYIESKVKMGFFLCSYTKSEGVPSFNKEYIECDYDMNGDNPIKQAYAHLKTLERFTDYADV